MTARLRTSGATPIRRRGVAGRLLGLALIGLLAACTDDPQPSAAERDAAMYGSVVQDLVDRSGVELGETWIEPVVFVGALETNTIELDTQIMVIDQLRDFYSIRFIDDIIEAIDQQEDQQPVRPGTLLVVFGPVEMDETEYTLHAEYYLAAGETAAFRYRFENRQPASAARPSMVMTDPPARVETLLVVTP